MIKCCGARGAWRGIHHIKEWTVLRGTSPEILVGNSRESLFYNVILLVVNHARRCSRWNNLCARAGAGRARGGCGAGGGGGVVSTSFVLIAASRCLFHKYTKNDAIKLSIVGATVSATAGLPRFYFLKRRVMNSNALGRWFVLSTTRLCVSISWVLARKSPKKVRSSPRQSEPSAK